METVLTPDAAEWARSRFVRSRLWEVNHAIGLLASPRRQLPHRSWLETVDAGTARARCPVVGALQLERGWVPDFLVPVPRDRPREVGDELAEVAQTPLELVTEDVRRSLESAPTRSRRAVLEPLLCEPRTVLDLVVAELRWAWENLLEPFWPQVTELLDADVRHRSGVMARAGIGGAIDGLHPRVKRRGDAIVLSGFGEGTVDLRGDGVALMPSAFVWPGLALVAQAPGWPVTLVYPARGIAELWSRPPVPAPALVEVLGTTRARLLVDLGAPVTTTTLAARHGLSPAAVSTQLGRLRDAHLAAATRTGREVFYRRTALADALLRGSGPEPQSRRRSSFA